MDKDTKELALHLLIQKQSDLHLTYELIERETGYSKRQLIRLSSDLQEKDMESIMTHGNAGRKPVTTASDQEVSYLREMKKPYPLITVAQFRDIFIEDVIENPKKKSEVKKYRLKPRSISWFRELFIKEGWTSPAQKAIREEGSHVTHPIRKPRPCRGELVQIDGTPFDWFGDGRVYTLHLAVDDATTEVLAGWFMPTECTCGYCRMMRLILEKYGVPEALYSDRDSVFRSVKGGGITQYAMMMEDLHIQTIFALSAQSKGRIERYNGTAQLRLPNDIKRFGINHDYNELNKWFNDFYIKYMNRKFAFTPLDPHDAFICLPKDFDYSEVFRIRETRRMSHNMFSYKTAMYSLFNSDGELMTFQDKTTVNIYTDVFTEELYAIRYGKRYSCMQVGENARDKSQKIENQKDLQEFLNDYRRKK